MKKYEKLIADIEEIGLNPDFRFFWFERALECTPDEQCHLFALARQYDRTVIIAEGRWHDLAILQSIVATISQVKEGATLEEMLEVGHLIEACQKRGGHQT